jgi:hypothetical protein
VIAVADKPISVVPDTGTEQAARLAAEHSGNPVGGVVEIRLRDADP